MTADYVSYDDLAWADEQMIRAHAAELIAMAESLGPADLRYASSNRIVDSRNRRLRNRVRPALELTSALSTR